jgi:hypothetical protein
MTTALEEGESSDSRPGRSLPPEKSRYPLYRRLDGPPRPVWTGAENLAPTGIRSPDRPARSQSLYRLRYPAHIWQRAVSEIWCVFKKNSALYHAAFLQNNPTKLLISMALISVVRRYEISAVRTAFFVRTIKLESLV